MELTPQRGAIALELDRPRVLFFDLAATRLLTGKYGGGFLRELYEPAGDGVQVRSMEALVYFVWAGLVRDDREVTLEQVELMLGVWNYTDVFNAVLKALTGAMSTGKLTATGSPAKPAAAAHAAPQTPGPTKVSTSMRRSASRTASSASRRKRSGG